MEDFIVNGAHGVFTHLTILVTTNAQCIPVLPIRFPTPLADAPPLYIPCLTRSPRMCVWMWARRGAARANAQAHAAKRVRAGT